MVASLVDRVSHAKGSTLKKTIEAVLLKSLSSLDSAAGPLQEATEAIQPY
jgi:hypothetical protein